MMWKRKPAQQILAQPSSAKHRLLLSNLDCGFRETAALASIELLPQDPRTNHTGRREGWPEIPRARSDIS